MKHFTLKNLFILILLFSSPDAWSQNTVTLSPDQDNSIFELLVNRSNGAGPEIFTGAINSDVLPLKRRSLIQFPVAEQIPANAIITDAYIELYCIKASNSGVSSNYSFHRLNESWGEGNSVSPNGQGVQADDNEATWNTRFYFTILWMVEGGNFNSAVSATLPVNQKNEYYQWSSEQLIQDVQNMIDAPDSNFGWLLKAEDEEISGTGRAFGSKENENSEFRPKLVITYETPSSLNSNINANDWMVYPNPGKNELTIETSGSFAGERYQIMDMQGRIIKEDILNSSLTRINTDDLRVGYYFISFPNSESKTIRWIKK